MKKVYLLLFFTAFITLFASAQTISFNYQAVARDMNDQPYKGTDDEPMQVAVSILDGTDTEVYGEEHEDVRTSSLGIFNLRIGEGTNKNGDLSAVNWSTQGPFELEVTIRVGVSSAKKLPRSRLVFVPFAIYATKAGDLEHDLGGDVSGKYTDVQLNAEVVGTAEIADNAVTTEKITALGVKTADLDDNAVTNSKIANEAVKTATIEDNAVTTEKIAANGVTKSDIINSAVDSTKLAIDAVTSSKIKNEEVMTADIRDGAVTSAKLAKLGAIQQGQVLKWSGTTWTAGTDNDGASTGAGGDLSGPVSNLQIKSGVVGSTEIANDSVTSADILNGSIISADIADGTIGGNDLNSTLNFPQTGLTISGGPLKITGSTTKSDHGNPVKPFLKLGGGVQTPRTHYFLSGSFLQEGVVPQNWIAYIPEKGISYEPDSSRVINFPNVTYTASVNPNLATDANSLYSIWADQRIICPEFNAVSDLRVKNVLGLSNISSDKRTLLNLTVKNFRYKDIVEKGSNSKKGFIAQEVEQVFPEAVNRTTDFIPDIYQIARKIQYEPAQHTLSLTVDSLTGGLKAGDKLRIIADQQREVIVSAVKGTTITVADWPVADTKEAFVYGKQVNDFRVVDYDRIFTLNVSATQALIAEVDELKAQVAALQAQNSLLNEQNTGLGKGLQNLESRFNALTARLDAPAVRSGRK